MQTLLGLILAIIVATLIIALVLYRQKNDRKEKVQCERMLMDVFEMQIHSPELSLVYDDLKEGASSELLEKYNLKKEPFIIYTLSVFDLVVDYYYGHSLFASKDSVMKSAWVNTIRNFYRDSSDGRDTFLAHHDEFNSRFQKFSDDVLEALAKEATE